MSSATSSSVSSLPHTSSFSASEASINAAPSPTPAGRSSRWRAAGGLKRPSLKNLLLGLHTSSWTSQPPSSSLTDPAQLPQPPAASSTPAPPSVAEAEAPTPLASGLIAAPVTVVATNTLPSALTSDAAEVGGGKTIDYVGSVALLINNVTGGGMVLFAQMYQEAGWLLPTLTLLLLMVICGTGGLMLVECMAMMPNNGSFRRRIEYTSVMRHYCSHRAYQIIHLFFQLSLTITNLSLIVQSIQVMDFTIVAIAGKSCTVPQFAPSFAFACPEKVDNNITPFATDVWCIPLGLYFTALFVIPLGLVNLDDNIKVQKAAFYSLITIVLIWVGVLAANGPSSSRVPVLGASFSTVLGTSLFNFAFVSSVPSWVNEKREDVSIVRTLCIVLPLAVGIFVLMGWLGGAAFPDWTTDVTLLDQLKSTGIAGEITFYAFPIIVNLTSIPVLSIFQRYNLLKERVCGRRMANFLAVALPWLIAIPLYNGSGYQNLANWGGVLVTSVVNFIIPTVVYIIAVRRREREMEELRLRRERGELLTPAAAATADPADGTVVVVRTEEAQQEQATEAAQTERPTVAAEKKRSFTLSVSAAVEWLRGDNAFKKGEEPQSGLRPSPLQRFTGQPSSSSFSIASTDGSDNGGEITGPQHSPTAPLPATRPAAAANSASTALSTSPAREQQLNPQAIRWAAEADRLSGHLAAMATSSGSYARDSTQPATGSLRLAPPSGSASRSPSAPPSAHSSQQNLLAGLASSSFTGRSHRRPDDDESLEMTPVSSAQRAASGSREEAAVAVAGDDFLDIDAIAVEEHDAASDEEASADEDEKAAPAPHAAASGLSSTSPPPPHAHLTLPAIDESEHSTSAAGASGVWTEDVEEKIRAEEEADAPLSHETVVQLVQDDVSGHVWHVVGAEWEKYRIPTAVLVLAVMLTLCIIALEQQIASSM